ncbi:MAG: trigger factor [Chloroflexi bacterium]|nr:trigger factor [Chloroflexota bacterium]
MKVTTEKLPQSRALLHVEAESQEMEASLDKAYRRLVDRVAVPGFRKGKAPRTTLERHVGREALVEEAIEILVPEAYNRAIKEQNIDAIAQPQIEMLQREPVAFKATVAVRPVITLGDYNSLNLEPDKVAVTPEEVDQVVEQLRSLRAPWEPVERACQMGDLLTMDVRGVSGGEAILQESNIQYQLVAGSGVPVPGFAEKLEGAASGEKRAFTIEFASDYGIASLAGKKFDFSVSVKEIKSKRLPEVNDDFARIFGQGILNLEGLRQNLEGNLRARKEAEAQRRVEDRAIEATIQMSQIEYPEIMEEWELEHILQDQDTLVRSQGSRLEDYLKSRNTTLEQVKEELRPQAKARVLRSLVLDKLQEVEKIEITEAEVNAEIDRLIVGAAEQREEMLRLLQTPGGRESVKSNLGPRRAAERLAAIATRGYRARAGLWTPEEKAKGPQEPGVTLWTPGGEVKAQRPAEEPPSQPQP